MEKYTGLEIAVIGLSGRFPGAENIEQYWENLKNGKDCIAEISESELLQEGESEAKIKDPFYVKANAYITNKEYFDAAFFNYTPDEAELMDPQMRIYHECCWEALEDSGYNPIGYADKIGVFASGTPNVPWVLHALIKNRLGLVDDFTAYHLRDVTFLSTRISYKLNLKGPAIFVQTACSSSLVAIHEACNSLLLRECTMALAGGINIQNHSKKGYVYQEGMIRSRDGKCRPFDADSSGTVGGEGAGVVVLKRLQDAIRDRDNIYAVITGTAINNDGSNKVGYTAPGVTGQAEAIKKAHRMAGIKSDSISYVEAHGTATELGDAVEIEALNKAFDLNKAKHCVIGSVKSNIGHLDSAAGVAGFIKTVLAIKNRQIPPTLHFKRPNPKIQFDNGPFYVVNTLTNWQNLLGPLRAGVSSFGIGGTNAHVVLEEAPLVNSTEQSRNDQLIVLSAKTKTSLERNSILLIEYLQQNKEASLSDIAYTLQKGRERFRYRKILVCSQIEEAIKGLMLNEAIEGEVVHLHEHLQNIIFMFPGQGTQYADMCKGLYAGERIFKENVDECLRLASLFSTEDLRSVLFPGEDSKYVKETINNTKYSQPLLFIVEYSLAKLFMAWGIQPHYMIGHSIGEYTAACISGVLSLNDAIRLVIKRGEVMSQVKKGCMLSIDMSEEQLKALTGTDWDKRIDVAVINSEHTLVVSGTATDIEAFEKILTEQGYTFKRLHTSHAFHSKMMDGILKAFEQEVLQVEIQEPHIPYISNLTGEPVTYDQIKKASYWSAHLRNTVQFLKGTDALLKMGDASFIEIGPGRTLCNYISQNKLRTERHHLINTVRQFKQTVSDTNYLLQKLGTCWLHGINIDWDGFYADEKRKKVSLPGYSFDGMPYTTNFNVDKLLNGGFQNQIQEHSDDTGDLIHIANWKRAVSPNQPTLSAEESNTFLVFTGKASFPETLILRLRACGQKVIEIKQGRAFKQISDEQFELNCIQPDGPEQLWSWLERAGIKVTNIIYAIALNDGPGSVTYGCIEEKLNDGYLGLCCLAKTISSDRLNITVITNYLSNITGSDYIDPLKAAIHAPARIMPSEISTVGCKVIDIPYPFNNETEIQEYVSKIVNEIFYTDKEPFVAYRFRERWVQYPEAVTENDKTLSDVGIKRDGVYIITGGFGGMGFAVANDLVLNHHAHVVIVHRSDFPKRETWESWLQEKGSNNTTSQKIQQLKAMESTGCMVNLYQADMGVEEDVKQLLFYIKQKHTNIKGLIWAAGEVDYGGIILKRSNEDFIKYTTSKIHGLLLFEKYLDFGTLDFLALFSSIGNDFYQIKFGQVAYNASNEFLEAFALYARNKWNIHAFAINWCDWLDVGMAVKTTMKETGIQDINVLNTKISNGIYPGKGVEVFNKCIQYKEPVYIIYPGDIAKALKLQKERLIEFQGAAPVSKAEPENHMHEEGNLEQRLIEIFSSFFGRDDIKPKDDFFELGGDSLKAMTLVGRINKKTGATLSISDIYKHPTISDLHHALLSHTLQNKNRSIPPAPVKNYYPLSSEQRRMYFLQNVQEDSIAYNETELLWMNTALNKSRIEEIFKTLIKRHESLRTSFVVNEDGLWQKITDEFVFEVTHLERGKDNLDEMIQAFIRPFDLSKAPLYRVGVVETGHEEYLLLIDSHHIVLDAASKNQLISELMTLYRNEPLPVLPTQYKDYTWWQHSDEQKKIAEKHKSFWLKEFLTQPEQLQLPVDFAKTVSMVHPGDCYAFELNVEETNGLKSIAAAHGTSLFAVLLSVYNVLLARLSNQEDIVVGTPISGRHHADLENTVGMFVNTLALRNYPVAHTKFDDFLSDVKSRMLQCFEHQLCQFEDLVDELKIERDLSRNPLFDTMFVFQKLEDPIFEMPGFTIKRENGRLNSARFEMTLSAAESETRILLSLAFAADLFRRDTIERFARYFKNIVSHILADTRVAIADIEMMSEKEKHQLLFEFNETALDFPVEETILSLFEKQVQKTPGNTAVIFENNRVSYLQLNAFAETIAQKIHEKLPYGNHIVGLLFKPGPAMMAAILGIWKAGCAYVPLSPAAPAERNLYILTDCNAALLLVHHELKHKTYSDEQLIENEKIIFVAEEPEQMAAGDQQQKTNGTSPEKGIVAGDNLVNIIYTSGTSGRPKGVEIRHRGLVNFIYWRILNYRFTAEDVTLQLVPYHFDGFGADVYHPLISGGAIAMIPEEQKLNADYIIKLIRSAKVTNFTTPPGLYSAILDECNAGNTLPTLRFVTLAGDMAQKSLLKKSRLLLPHIELVNEYGPTEGTVAATCNNTLHENNNAVIGKPIQNTAIYILGKNKALLPVGVYGELCISGVGLAKGYVNNAALTKEKFVDNPFVPGTRMYKTGDIARWLPDGNIEISGRVDAQIKIRGFRIEPGEIERRLSAHEQIIEALVMAPVMRGEKHLVAYYLSEQKINDDNLRHFLSDKLPDYMIPVYYIHMGKFPYTAVGKLDRKALPLPEMKSSHIHVAAVTKEEKLLVDIWEKVLGIENIGVTDNFFTAGGDSIKSIQIASRMRTAGYEITVKDIFNAQTIKELALRVKSSEVVADQSPVLGMVPLTPIQQWFFEGFVTEKYIFNQSVLVQFNEQLTEKMVSRMFKKLQEHHDALRMVFRVKEGMVVQENLLPDLSVSLQVFDVQHESDRQSFMSSVARTTHAGIDLAKGPLMKLCLFHLPEGSRLLIVIHHLVIDGISWRILFEDIETLYRQIKNNEPLSLPLKSDSFRLWSMGLGEYRKSHAFQQAKQYWNQVVAHEVPLIKRDGPGGHPLIKDRTKASFCIDKDTTTSLLTDVHVPFNTRMNDILLTALFLSVKKEFGSNTVRIDLEGHGREAILPQLNISRTVGWFTSMYPVILKADSEELSATIKQVKETLRAVPNNGVDYLLLKYGEPDAGVVTGSGAQINFNYLGQFDTDTKDKLYQISEDTIGNEYLSNRPGACDWEIGGMVNDDCLHINLSYNTSQYKEDTIHRLLHSFKEQLERLIQYCTSRTKKELTPSDVTHTAIPVEQLDELQHRFELEDIYPLSPMQEGMLFHSLLNADAGSYFEQISCTLDGTFDVMALEKSMDDLVARYDVFRTMYLSEGYERPLQVVLKNRKPEFNYADVRHECLQNSKEDIIRNYQIKDRTRKFRLDKDVLIRLSVLQTNNDEYVFIWSFHHILMDGWCIKNVLNDFDKFYIANSSKETLSLNPVTRYSTYIKWLQTKDTNESLHYWKSYLNDYAVLAGFTKKETALTENGAPSFASKHLLIDKEQVMALHQVAAKYGVTINIIFQVAWGILLAKYNNVNDVVFGSVVSGRPAEMNGVEDMVGLFINTIPVRICYTDGDVIGDILQEAQKKAVEAEPHHYSPLFEIQAVSSLGRDLLDHILVFENYPLADEVTKHESGHKQAAGFTIKKVEVFEQTNYDLSVMVVPGTEFQLKIDYNVDKYEEASVEKILQHFHTALTVILSDTHIKISDINILSEQERYQQLYTFNDTEVEYLRKTIMDLFREQVKINPANVALRCDERTLSFRYVDEQSDKMASYLIEQYGVKKGDLIGVLLTRDEYLIITIFSILKAGCAYVPMDPEYPAERINSIIEDSALNVLITRKRHLSSLIYIPAGLTDLDEYLKAVATQKTLPLPTLSEHDLAYVIYTSGSTGKPKGVMIEHGNVVNRLHWKQHEFQLLPKDVLLLKSPVVFDASVWELFWWSFTGASVCILKHGGEKEPQEIINAIRKNKVTVISFVPSMLGAFLAFTGTNCDDLQSLRLVFAGGEALKAGHVEAFAKTIYKFYKTRLVNRYGPTEATIDVSHYECDLEKVVSDVPIGKPIANVHLYVLDKYRQLLPIGVPGELYIAGGLARGYLNNEELTAEKFVENPHIKNERIYGTGDLVKLLPDGNIEYLNRIDDQVKVRGFRIELGEIENHLCRLQQVKEAVVMVREKNGEKYLAAYYAANSIIEAEELKNGLLKTLPDFMVPAYYVHLHEFPLNSNGKINRKALPEPEFTAGHDYTAPLNEVEEKMVAIWCELLKLNKEEISTDKSFFELGGHSIMAIHLINAIQQKFVVRIELRKVFEYSSVTKLCEYIAGVKAENLMAIPDAGEKEYYTTSPAQERMFFQQFLHKDSLVYNVSGALEIRGHISINRLKESFQLLVNRHEGLRTSFMLHDEEVVQKINAQVDFELTLLNRDQFQTQEEAFADFIRPFDLSAPTLMRCGLLQLSDTSNILFIDIHHIACDGISLNILIKDFESIYLNKEPEQIDIRYVDYAYWQRNSQNTLAAQKEFWRKKLSEEIQAIDLPVMQSRERVTIGDAAVMYLEINGELYHSAKSFVASANVSDFMFLLSVYYVLLAKMTGQRDIIIGTDVAGRTKAEFKNIVGNFINILPLRMLVSAGKTYRQFLEETKECVLQAFENQDFQFDQMVSLINRDNSLSGNPIVQVHFAFANYVINELSLNDLEFIPLNLSRNLKTQYEFKIEVTEHNDKFRIAFIYSKELYDSSFINVLMNYYLFILKQAVGNASINIEEVLKNSLPLQHNYA